MRLAAALLAVACSGGEGPTAPAGEAAGTAALDGGWPDRVLRDPDAFARAIDADRAGWAALHAGDLEAAARSADPALRARALGDLAAFELDLARMAGVAWELTFSTWRERAGLPEGSAIPVVAALAAVDAGQPDRAEAWLALAGDDPRAAAVRAFAEGRVEAAPGDPFSACLAAHLEARATARLDPLAAACGDGPLLRDEGGAVVREFWDPLVYRTRAVAHGAQAEAVGAADAPELVRLLFGPAWTTADLAAPARGPTLAALELAGPPPAADSVDAARTWVRTLDTALDAWSAGRLRAVEGEGAAVFRELDLPGVWRSRILVEQARAAIDAGHPRRALAYVQLAMDVQHARELGPRNPPALYALVAEAQLRTGHAREALDALQVLADAFPFVRGLDETVGDLAVLLGLGRTGDSKEN